MNNPQLLDLGPRQLRVLAYLATTSTWPPPAPRTRSEQAILSRSVAALEARGLVLRDRAHPTSKTREVLLTRAGRRLVEHPDFARLLLYDVS